MEQILAKLVISNDIDKKNATSLPIHIKNLRKTQRPHILHNKKTTVRTLSDSRSSLPSYEEPFD